MFMTAILNNLYFMFLYGVLSRRRSAVPRHERLHSKHNRNDSMKERDKRVSDKPDPEKHRSRPSDVDLHKERSGSLRQSRYFVKLFCV